MNTCNFSVCTAYTDIILVNIVLIFLLKILPFVSVTLQYKLLANYLVMSVGGRIPQYFARRDA